MNNRILPLKTRHIKGVYWRGIPERFASTSLESGPNFHGLTRYALPRIFSALHFSSSLELSQNETTRKLDGDGEPITYIKYRIEAEGIVDLTEASVRNFFKVSLEDIVKPKFQPGAYTETHRIAAAVYNNQLNGLLAPSAHSPENKEICNLVLYPARLIRGFIREIE